MFRKHADVAIAMGASPVPSPTKSPKPTRSWTSDGQPRSWTTETWAWEETINTDEPRGYLAGHRVRRERQERQERLGSPSPSVQSYMDPRSYRRRRSEQRLEVSTKAVDVCLQELLDATEAERVRVEREMGQTHRLISHACKEERRLDHLRGLNEAPWETQLRSPRKLDASVRAERDRRQALLNSFTAEICQLKAQGAIESARATARLDALQERLALIVGIRSHAAGAIEADLFVERAMRAARQRLDASRSERQRPELDSSTFRTFGVLSP